MRVLTGLMAVCLVCACKDPGPAEVATADRAPSENEAALAAARDNNRAADFFAQEPVDVTAKQLAKLYRDNEMAAREKYLGRPLRIDGRVERVGVERIDGREMPVLYFAEGGICVFNMGTPQPELSRLRRGQRVVVLGQPRGAKGGQHLTTHCSLDSWFE